MFVSAEQYAGMNEVEGTYVAAAHIEPVEGGWMVFESAFDYDVWAGQA